MDKIRAVVLKGNLHSPWLKNSYKWNVKEFWYYIKCQFGGRVEELPFYFLVT